MKDDEVGGDENLVFRRCSYTFICISAGYKCYVMIMMMMTTTYMPELCGKSPITSKTGFSGDTTTTEVFPWYSIQLLRYGAVDACLSCGACWHEQRPARQRHDTDSDMWLWTAESNDRNWNSTRKKQFMKDRVSTVYKCGTSSAALPLCNVKLTTCILFKWSNSRASRGFSTVASFLSPFYIVIGQF